MLAGGNSSEEFRLNRTLPLAASTRRTLRASTFSLSDAGGLFWIAVPTDDTCKSSNALRMSPRSRCLQFMGCKDLSRFSERNHALLNSLHRPVVIAVVSMRMVQAAPHQIIHMVPVRDGLMSALRTVNVLCIMPVCTVSTRVGIGLTHFDDMLVHMISVDVMEMPVVQIIPMSLMLDRGVPAARAVLVGVVFMLFAITHRISFSCNCRTQRLNTENMYLHNEMHKYFLKL